MTPETTLNSFSSTTSGITQSVLDEAIRKLKQNYIIQTLFNPYFDRMIHQLDAYQYTRSDGVIVTFPDYTSYRNYINNEMYNRMMDYRPPMAYPGSFGHIYGVPMSVDYGGVYQSWSNGHVCKQGSSKSTDKARLKYHEFLHRNFKYQSDSCTDECKLNQLINL